METSPLASRLVSGVAWSAAGAAVSRGLMLAATVTVARILGKTPYGELGMIQSTVGMFGVFAGFGLGLTATKYIAEFRHSDPARAGRILGLSGTVALLTGGLMAVGLALYAPWLAEKSISAPHLGEPLRIAALILFFSALNGSQTGALAGFEAFKRIAQINVAVGLLSFPMLITGAYVGGLSGTVWAMVLNTIINWLLSHLAIRSESRRSSVPFRIAGCHREWYILWKFSLPAVLSGLMVMPANWAARAMLANQPSGYAELGTLTAAMAFQTIVLFVSGTLSAPLLSMITNEGSRSSSRLSKINILSSWIFGVAAAVPLLCFPEVAQFIFGPDFATHSFRVTLSLVVMATAIMTYKAGLARVLAARSLLWWGLLGNAVWAVVLIGASVFLVRWGAIGQAMALTIAYAVNTILLIPLYQYRRLVPKRTLVSPEALLIWAVLVSLLIMNVYDVPLLARAAASVPLTGLVVLGFIRLSRADD